MSHMDHVAPTYDETIPAHVREHYLRKRVAFIRARLSRGRILDVGCGTGMLGAALRQAGLDVVGIDESMGMLGECRQRQAILCVRGSSARLPFGSDSMDAAICIATLHHIENPEQVQATVQEMLRVVKPGGWILLWDHNPLNPYWPFLMRRLPQDQEPIRLVPLRELLANLATRDVVRIDARRSGFMPEFASPRLMWLFQAMERLIERTPGLRWLCAHNVVVAVKGAPGEERGIRCG